MKNRGKRSKQMSRKDGPLTLWQIQREFLDFSNCGHKYQYNRRRFGEQAVRYAGRFGGYLFAIRGLGFHRDVDLVLSREINRAFVASIDVTQHAHAWVAR
jgi:hypothetical protein